MMIDKIFCLLLTLIAAPTQLWARTLLVIQNRPNHTMTTIFLADHRQTMTLHLPPTHHRQLQEMRLHLKPFYYLCR